jgi:hypothetical protein
MLIYAPTPSQTALREYWPGLKKLEPTIPVSNKSLHKNRKIYRCGIYRLHTLPGRINRECNDNHLPYPLLLLTKGEQPFGRHDGPA